MVKCVPLNFPFLVKGTLMVPWLPSSGNQRSLQTLPHLYKLPGGQSESQGMITPISEMKARTNRWVLR